MRALFFCSLLVACRSSEAPKVEVAQVTSAVASESYVVTEKKITGPSPREGMAAGFDRGRGMFVLQGGIGTTSTGGTAYYSDTWEWDGAAWSRKATTGPNLTSAKIVYDVVRGHPIYVGYNGALSATGWEMWEWGGSGWTRFYATAWPSPWRSEFALVADEARKRIVMFGGSGGTGGIPENYNDTHEYDGTTWALVTPATTKPGARRLAAMVYDAARARVVMFGGAGDGVTRFGDTWEWDGVDWKQRVVTPSPDVRAGAAFVYDPVRKVSVLHGGYPNADTWEWNGTAWTKIAIASPPPDRYLHAMVYDDVRREHVMFGGYGGSSILGDTWTLHTHGGACASDAECHTGHCVDSVCCETASCSTCSACDRAASPGICAPVVDAIDPDTCSGDKKCNAKGSCSLTDGKACTLGADCASGFCVEGVCCNTACKETCRSCTATNKVSGSADGICDLAKASTDPHDDCVTDPIASCGRDGMCDGAGACRFYAAGTSCGASMCEAGSVSGQVCDGFGLCKSVAGMSCAPGLCKAGACSSSCTTATDCDASAYCESGACKAKKINGDKCTAADSCASGFCVDGVCCKGACTGQCEACDVAGAVGTCVAFTGAPHAMRPACAKATAGNPCSEEACDGSVRTSCAGRAGSTVSCRAAKCVDGVATIAASCAGDGSCPAEQTKRCEPYVCDADQCKSACNEDRDCATGYSCDPSSHKCIAGATCDGDHTIRRSGGTPIDCAPFKCEGVRCKETCGTSADCVAPALCNAGVCTVASTDDDGGGCSIAHRRAAGGATLFALALGLLVRRRRAR